MTQEECAEARWGHWNKGQMTNHGMRQFDRIAPLLAFGHSRRDVAVWRDISLSRIQLLLQQARKEYDIPGELLGRDIAKAWCERRKLCVGQTPDVYAEMSRMISGSIESGAKSSLTLS